MGLDGDRDGALGAGVRLDALLSMEDISELHGVHRQLLDALVNVFVAARQDPEGHTVTLEATVDATVSRLPDGELRLWVSRRIVGRRRRYRALGG